ncbi:MAG: hypothetical protein AAF517_11415, partial [Planctomycetota bacterium]
MPDNRDWEPGCNEKSGFLFKHSCENAADERCDLCTKPICRDHAAVVDGAFNCVTCSKERLRKSGGGGSSRSRHRSHHDDDFHYYP